MLRERPLFWFLHNTIAHPLSGLLGFVGLDRAARWVHDLGVRTCGGQSDSGAQRRGGTL